MSELVVITGATGGIGRCVAMKLAERGFVPVIGHRAARTEEARKIAQACGGLPVRLDMSDLPSIDIGIGQIVDDGRPVAGVVIAASPSPVIAQFGKITPADHALFWNANVIGPHHLLAGLVRSCFRPRKSGSVVAVLTAAMDSAGSRDGEPKAMSGMGAYTISKYGLQGVMAQLKGDFPWLKASSVKPGFTETEMLKAFDDRFLDQMRQHQGFARAEDVAAEIIGRLALESK